MSGDSPDTPAIRSLAGASLPYAVVVTQPARSAQESAQLQGIELGSLIRTIVVRVAADDYAFVLVPAGRRIAWPRLRSHLGTNRLSLPDAEEARAVTGYERGTITPFGALTPWRVIADEALAKRELVAIGGGAPGINLHVAPADLVRYLDAAVADVTDADE